MSESVSRGCVEKVCCEDVSRLRRLDNRPAVTSFEYHFWRHEMNGSHCAVTFSWFVTHRDIGVGAEECGRGATGEHRVGAVEVGGNATAGKRRIEKESVAGRSLKGVIKG